METKGKSTRKAIGEGVVLWVALMAFFVLSLVLAFSIPRAWIQEHVDRSLETLQKEGEYPTPFFHTYSYRLDNVTDELMIRVTEQPDRNEKLAALIVGDHTGELYEEGWEASAWEKAMVGGHPRYWHGYVTVLRPLLVVTDYIGIRYLNMIAFFLLMFFSFVQVYERLGRKIACGYLLTLLMVYAFGVPMCMGFTTVFLIVFVSVFMLFQRYDAWAGQPSCFGNFFLAIGSVTAFLDLLEAPLLTLGIPLLFWCVLEGRQKRTARQVFCNAVVYSVIWGIAYGMTWAGKWGIASVFLKKNVISIAMQSVLLRIGVSEGGSVNLLQMLMGNIGKLFASDVGSGMFKMLCLGSVLMAAWFFKEHKPWREVQKNLVLLFVSLYPFGWYLALSNHSSKHAFFTYRLLWISLLGIWCFWAESLRQRE
ncbi:MAG: hypothetical protein HFI39_10110 [Lachnospiraceae bacterium]|nr:hypothetical protein [Lachnospiraceae bacterium]MCI8820827.1 hypothetical protein [Clostridia bacterium]